ncbi:hypothetical protein ACN47E_005220 [Coniothyrium glycines]
MSTTDRNPGFQHTGNVNGLRLTLGLCLCYTLCVIFLRAYIRWRAFGADDVVVLVSTIVSLAFFGSSYASAAAGIGRSLDDLNDRQDVSRLNRHALAGNITWITALCLSKIAIIATLLRTTETLFHRRVHYTAVVLVTAQWITSLVLLTARCSSSEVFSWDMTTDTQTCPGMDTRWLVITILDVLTETLLLVLPVHLVRKLQMSSKNKAIVIAAFWLRLPTLIFTVLRHRATHRLTFTANVSRTVAIVIIWQAVELSYALAAVTIAALKRFTESLNTGFGHGELMRVHGPSYKMSDRSKSSTTTNMSQSRSSFAAEPNMEISVIATVVPEQGRRSSETADPGSMKLRPERLRNTTEIFSPPKVSAKDRRSLDSTGSENGIIRHHIQYSVHYDENPIAQRDQS